LKDDKWVLDLYERLWSEFDDTEKGYHILVGEILSLTKHWEKNLLEIEGLKEEVVKYLELIDKKGMKEALKEVV
jgi:tagaturonate reductase